MADLPYFKFFPADYLRDTEILSLSAQGGWMRMLCSMWHPSRRGVLGLRLQALARLLGANEQATRSIVDEIEDCGVAEVLWDDDRVTISSRRMVRDWEHLAAEKTAQVEAGKAGAEKRWGKNRAKHGEPNSPPISLPIKDPIPAPTPTQVAIQKAEDRSQKGGERAGAKSPPPLSPANMLPVDRVKIELATVFPDAPKHMTGGEQHDLFGSLAVLDELTPEDWQACRGWVICPDRVRGRKLWPRDRAEFVANAGQAIEAIRQWWKTGGRSWWNQKQGTPPPKPKPSPSAEPTSADFEDPAEALEFFRKADPNKTDAA